MNKFKHRKSRMDYQLYFDYRDGAYDSENVELQWTLEENYRHFQLIEWKSKLCYICIHALGHFNNLKSPKAGMLLLRKNYEKNTK